MFDYIVILSVPFAATASYKSNRKVGLAIIHAIFAAPYLIYWIFAHNSDLKNKPLFGESMPEHEQIFFKVLMFWPSIVFLLTILGFSVQSQSRFFNLALSIIGLLALVGLIVGVPLSLYRLNKFDSTEKNKTKNNSK